MEKSSIIRHPQRSRLLVGQLSKLHVTKNLIDHKYTLSENFEGIKRWKASSTEMAGVADSEEVEGVSLVPVINGKDERSDRSLYWHFPFYHPPGDYEGTTPSSAIRTGNYKLIYFYEDGRSELYNLKDDISEEHDLSDRNPVKTTQLKKQLFKHLKSVGARFRK